MIICYQFIIWSVTMKEFFLKKINKVSWTNPLGQRQWKSHHIIKKWSALVTEKYNCSGGWIGWRVHLMNIRSMVWIYLLAKHFFVKVFQPKKKTSEPIWAPGLTSKPCGSISLWPVLNRSIEAVVNRLNRSIRSDSDNLV